MSPNPVSTERGQGHLSPIISIDDLSIAFNPMNRNGFKIIENISFKVMPGERVAIVGESGSGKTVTAMSIMRLLDGMEYSGKISYLGEDLLDKSENDMRHIRGREISMTFQDSLSTLNPIMKIGQQIAEVLTIRGIKKSTAKESTLELLRELGFDKPNEVYDFYPYQFSGGMRQRVMIAIALIANPRVLIADEPTTALDVRIQAQVMRLINKLAIERNLTVILISHDLGVVAGFADRVLVMYSGRIVEEGTTDEIFYESRHPYTKALLNSIPTVTRDPLIPLPAIKGVTPEPNQRLRGCVFQDRCTMVQHRCRNERPKLTMENYTHGYECFFPLELESFGVEPL